MKDFEKWIIRHYKYTRKSQKEIADDLGISVRQVKYYANKHNIKKLHNNHKIHGDNDIYALYIGDNMECMGTLNELSDKLDVKIKTLKMYCTKSHKERDIHKRVLVKVGGD